VGSRLTAFAATGVILSATYMLWMFQRVNYGPVNNEKKCPLPTFSPRVAVIVPPSRGGDSHGRSSRC